MSEVRVLDSTFNYQSCQYHTKECIVYTWDYHSSISFWSGLRVQPILSDEVQTFKALITVHKVLQEGHPVVRNLSAELCQRMNFDSPLDNQRGPRASGMARDLRQDRWLGRSTR
jgi:hypothetical protein